MYRMQGYAVGIVRPCTEGSGGTTAKGVRAAPRLRRDRTRKGQRSSRSHRQEVPGLSGTQGGDNSILQSLIGFIQASRLLFMIVGLVQVHQDD